MQGVNAYKLPEGTPVDAEIVDIGGFAYIWYPSQGVFTNLQAVSEKFKTWGDLDKHMTDKGVSAWLRQSQST